LLCRTTESFLKKGVTQVEAEKLALEYEERRKRSIELVLKEQISNNARLSTRKATSVLQ